MVGPVDDVRRRVNAPIVHGEEVVYRDVFIVRRVKVEPALVDHGCWIGRIQRLNDRIIGPRRTRGQTAGDY